MKRNDTKQKRRRAENRDARPGFKGFQEMCMGRCLPGRGGTIGCSGMGEMMKGMMEMCRPPKNERPEANGEQKKGGWK